MRESSERGWELVGLLILLLVGFLLWEYWEPITGTQPDARAKHGALWLPTTDVAQGDTLEGRVRIADGLRTAIGGVIVSGAGPQQVTKGREASWGNTIEWKLGESRDKNADELAFRVRIPADASTSIPLQLAIRVEHVSAQGGFEFRNEWDATTFELDIPVHSPAMSIARRVGRAALALASWLAVVFAVIGGKRWYGRRQRKPNDAWGFALLPYLVIGRVWFGRLLADATRLHTWWFMILCVVAWFLAFWLVARLTRRDTRRRYHVVQTHVPTATADAYRGGTPVPQKSIEDLVDAWQCAGLAVERDGDELTITNLEGHVANVRVPSGAFGAGEPFEVRTEYTAILLAMLPPAATLLGELRWQRAD